MTAGFEIYASDGSLAVSITDQLTKILGSQTITAPGSLTATRLQGNSLFATFIPNAGASSVSVQPTISISGDSISWSYASSVNRASGVLMWGQY